MHRDDHLLNCTFIFYLYVLSLSLSISWLVQWSFSLLLLFSLCFFLSFSLCSFSSLSHIFISIQKKKQYSLLIVECSLSFTVCTVLFERNGSSLEDKYTKFGNIHLFINYAILSARPTFMLIAYFDCSCDVKYQNLVVRIVSRIWFFVGFVLFFLFCCSCDHSLVIQCCELFFGGCVLIVLDWIMTMKSPRKNILDFIMFCEK